ncbi:hypothetical protein A1A1_07594 [Planococcus antarcticus DSM 14505]|uniref:DUF4181 domain-containing protein n=2 Tax=Planococcus TaxID=1372 RepID=A0AA87ILH6_9BACL|nr:DUF4181 domain-containing protein [Planococcus antarcticus]EIM07025.1 hypothetical protein A1A1_07594 [Planococcus antarcticus DSM 14505]
MYENNSSFWLDLLVILGPFFILTYLFNSIMRRWLKVEKPKMFSHNHVNVKHKKIDWTIRGLIVVLMIIGAFVNINRIPLEPILFLEPWFLLLILVTVTEIVRAVMEKKYVENPNAYIYTVSQLVFIMILLTSLFSTDFWGVL